jgi:hypothetical protein
LSSALPLPSPFSPLFPALPSPPLPPPVEAFVLDPGPEVAADIAVQGDGESGPPSNEGSVAEPDSELNKTMESFCETGAINSSGAVNDSACAPGPQSATVVELSSLPKIADLSKSPRAEKHADSPKHQEVLHTAVEPLASACHAKEIPPLCERQNDAQEEQRAAVTHLPTTPTRSGASPVGPGSSSRRRRSLSAMQWKRKAEQVAQSPAVSDKRRCVDKSPSASPT